MSFYGKNIPYISITSEEKNNENIKNKTCNDSDGSDTESDSSNSGANEAVSDKTNAFSMNDKKEDGVTDVENLDESDGEDLPYKDNELEKVYSYKLNLCGKKSASNSSKKNIANNDQYQNTDIQNFSEKLEIGDENISGGITDTEELIGSNDEADESIIEVNLSQILTDDINNINIIDDVKNFDMDKLRNEDILSKKTNKNKKAKKTSRKFQLLKKSNPYTNLTSSPVSPHLSDITDTEIIYSDSDDDKDEKQKTTISPKKRRSRGIFSKVKQILTDTEDIYISDRDGKPKLRREISLSKKPEFSGSNILTNQNIDIVDPETNSETDNEIVSIVPYFRNKRNIKDTKKNTSFTKMLLDVQNTESAAILTDVDDFEADDDLDEDYLITHSQEPESPNIPDQLLEMDSFYTTVFEESNTKDTPKFYITETFAVNKTQQKDKIYYTIEDLEEVEIEIDTSDSEKYLNETVKDECENGIVFYTNDNKISKIDSKIKNKNLNQNTLSILNTNEDGITDTENLNSSDEEITQNNIIPIAILKTNQIESDTDSEILNTDVEIDDQASKMDDIELPKPVCEQITIKYDSDGRPQVTIEPIVNQTTFGIYDSTVDDGKTDTEDMLLDEDILEDEYKDTTINIPMFDDDQNDTVIVTQSEIEKSGNKKNSPQKPIRKFKKANKCKKPYNKLTVEKMDNILTDKEDIDVSDVEGLEESGINVIKKSTLLARDDINVREIKTDVEDMGVSDDDLNEMIDLKRALSVTPDMMYFMSGNSIISKECDSTSASFTGKHILDYNEIPHIEMTSATPEIQPTDTEDVFTSADEEFTATYSRAETATPIETKNPYDDITASQVHVQYIGKFDETEEILHIKGGCSYPDMYTDIEDLGMSDDELYYEDKQQDVISKNNSKLKETHKTFITKLDHEEQSPARTASGPRELTDLTQQLSGEEIEVQDTAHTGEGWDQAQSSTVTQEDGAVSSASRVEIEEGVASSTAFQTPHDQREFSMNQQDLSDEMKELLKEMEEESRK